MLQEVSVTQNGDCIAEALYEAAGPSKAGAERHFELHFLVHFRALFTELDTSEVQLIMGTVLRLSIQKKDFTQMTYRQLLEDGKRYLDSLGNSSE